MTPRLCVSAGESPPADAPLRAMPLERAEERLQAHEAEPPAEARPVPMEASSLRKRALSGISWYCDGNRGIPWRV